MISSALKSFFDLFRPKVLALVIGIPFLAFIVWALIGFYSLGHASHWIVEQTSYLQGATAETGVTVFVTIVLVILLFPLAYWTSLILMSAIALPYIIRILKPQYPRAFAKQKNSGIISGWGQMLKVFLIAVPIYLVLLAFFWMPWIYAVGTFVLGAWVNVQFLSLEILSEFVDHQTMKLQMKKNSSTLWAMGFGLMFLLTVPFIQLITPVFGGLWFTHWWLQRLESTNLSSPGVQKS